MSRKSQRGGAQGAYPDSAWGFQMNNLGNLWNQTMNSLTVQPGQNLGASQSNVIVQNKAQGMSGGKRRKSGGKRRMSGGKRCKSGGKRCKSGGKRRMRGQSMGQSRAQSRGKKGGYWGAVLEQAAVPLALLGMQQAYGKRHTQRHGSSHKKSFRRGR
jgi:hypothetical protein